MIFSDPDIIWNMRLSANQGEPPEFIHVIIHVVEAESVDRAKQAATELASLFATGRETWWRAAPEAEQQTDFETGKVMIRGYARFSFLLKAGEHHRPLALKYPLGAFRFMPDEDGVTGEIPVTERGFGT